MRSSSPCACTPFRRGGRARRPSLRAWDHPRKASGGESVLITMLKLYIFEKVSNLIVKSTLTNQTQGSIINHPQACPSSSSSLPNASQSLATLSSLSNLECPANAGCVPLILHWRQLPTIPGITGSVAIPRRVRTCTWLKTGFMRTLSRRLVVGTIFSATNHQGLLCSGTGLSSAWIYRSTQSARTAQSGSGPRSACDSLPGCPAPVY